MVFIEFVQPAPQHIAPEVRRCGNAQASAHLCVACMKHGMRIFKRLECVLAMGKVDPALSGQPQLARRTLEQLRAQRRLELDAGRSR